MKGEKNDLQMQRINQKPLEIYENDTVYVGGDQDWYSTPWKKRAGCGPTNAALFVMYLALSHPQYAGLVPSGVQEKSKFIQLMETLWEYVTPTPMGVYKTKIFIDGLKRYGDERNQSFSFKVLNISAARPHRPSSKHLSDFLCRCLRKNILVPFLNNDNGKEKRLDTWHWVSLIGFAPESGIALIADEGLQKEIDLYLWLETTRLGGGFVGL